MPDPTPERIAAALALAEAVETAERERDKARVAAADYAHDAKMAKESEQQTAEYADESLRRAEAETARLREELQARLESDEWHANRCRDSIRKYEKLLAENRALLKHLEADIESTKRELRKNGLRLVT